MFKEKEPSIGQRVRALRERRGLSQKKLASMIPGVSQQSIDQLEQGKIARPRFLAELAEALGVPEPWLRTGKGESILPKRDHGGEDLDLMHDVVVVLERTLEENGLRLDRESKRLLARGFYELMLEEERRTPGKLAETAGTIVTLEKLRKRDGT